MSCTLTNILFAVAIVMLTVLAFWLHQSWQRLHRLQRDFDAIRERENLQRLSASEVACYIYPGEDQQELRRAFIEGAVYRGSK